MFMSCKKLMQFVLRSLQSDGFQPSCSCFAAGWNSPSQPLQWKEQGDPNVPCRRIWNKPVMISEPQGKGRVTAKRRKLCLTSTKWFMSLLSKSQRTSVSKEGCWCWISIFDATQKMICSGIVLNKIQNFIASWSTFINLIGSFPPPAPQDYFRNQCACSVSSPRV